MKRLKIQKQIKRESDQFTPDLYDQIMIAAQTENLLPKNTEQDAESYVRKNTAVKAGINRRSVGLLASLAAVATCLVILFVNLFGGGGNLPNQPVTVRLSAKDVYGMGAVSTVKLLGSNLPEHAVHMFAGAHAVSSKNLSGTSSEEAVKAQAEKFHTYFSALDSFLGDDIVSTSTTENTDGNYPYSTKMTITGKDLDANSVTYTMYYTETAAKKDSDDSEEEEDSSEETESEYSLEGVIVIDDTVYHLEGERSAESEKNESETELKLRAYADPSDKTSYIQMEQEYSVENQEVEREYVYSVYLNGVLIEQTAVEFETERNNGKEKTEYELEFRSGNAKGKYTVTRDNTASEMKVTYTIDGKTGEFYIRALADTGGKKQYEYTFSDHDKLIF